MNGLGIGVILMIAGAQLISDRVWSQGHDGVGSHVRDLVCKRYIHGIQYELAKALGPIGSDTQIAQTA